MKSNNKALRFLYRTVLGRIVLKFLTLRFISVICGKFMDSGASRIIIKRFVKTANIDLDEYEEAKYKSFNEFFTRKIKPEKRLIDYTPSHLISPCDGNLTVYKISETTVLPVKQSSYTIESLLRDNDLAERYKNGWCFVFRLGVNNYHRYCYADNCKEIESKYIKGILHTVRPIALEKYPVFTENCREYTLLDTENFKKIVQAEVGAMLVGKIKNHHKSGTHARGEEKGMFLYGGSTIILLAEENALRPCEKYLNASKEIPVKMGELIAEN